MIPLLAEFNLLNPSAAFLALPSSACVPASPRSVIRSLCPSRLGARVQIPLRIGCPTASSLSSPALSACSLNPLVSCRFPIASRGIFAEGRQVLSGRFLSISSAQPVVESRACSRPLGRLATHSVGAAGNDERGIEIVSTDCCVTKLFMTRFKVEKKNVARGWYSSPEPRIIQYVVSNV